MMIPQNYISFVRIVVSTLFLSITIVSAGALRWSSLFQIQTRTGSRPAKPIIAWKNIPEGRNCFTDAGESGTCTRLVQCPETLSFVKTNLAENKTLVLSYIERMLCQTPFDHVLVCCTSAQPIRNPAPVDDNPRPSDGIDFSSEVRNEEDCGTSDEIRVHGGTELQPGSQPWLAALGLTQSNGEFLVMCGGAIITRRHVLSASHCFDGLRIPTHVRLGEHSISKSDEHIEEIRIVGRKNPGYEEPTKFENDLELLLLERDIGFAENLNIRRICLPYSFSQMDFEGEFMNVAGWGITSSGRLSDVPLEIEVEITSLAQCRNTYQRSGVSINENKLCASQDGVDASCQGDSGGPLIYAKEFTRKYLIGIVSFGAKCGDLEYPGVYTRVSAYLEWIAENV